MGSEGIAARVGQDHGRCGRRSTGRRAGGPVLITINRVLITGAAGQDGSILSRSLSMSATPILGLVKPGHDESDLRRLKNYAPGIEILECDLRDQDRIVNLVREFEPTEIYNFGGISSITESMKFPELTREVNVGSVQAILAGMRDLVSDNPLAMPRLVSAASGTIFEGVDRSPQNEDTEVSPHSPYARSKAEVIDLLRSARTNEGLFTTSAILYNHESPLRGENFVTRKISMAVARIAFGQQSKLELGDIEVARDWGWAPDYVRAMQLMLAQAKPSDFVLGTGISHRLSFFVKKAFAAAGIYNWHNYVESTKENHRSADTNLLVGDSRKAYIVLGWRHSVDFDGIAKAMVDFDRKILIQPEASWDFFDSNEDT